MRTADFSRWVSLYAFTGVCCAIASILAANRAAVLLHRERIAATTRNWRAWRLLGPTIWGRWQKRCLLSTAVTLAIVAAFTFSLDWGT